MNGLEGAGVAGDLISGIGLILGLPVLLVGMLLRASEKGLAPIEVVLVADGGMLWARWFSAGEFQERPLSGAERARLAGQDVCRGYVSRRDPSAVRFERRTAATSVCLALGSTFVVLGVCGFALSLLPMVFG
ncbi:hypothetical protein [Citricoccus sp.]|uniref:hypothetical protein n=1 Tax=Citricoccus sp. TaxID=1978372 RepID=UPI0028BDE3D7|nr:hypothetical protein [Citricoccus sp.]